MTGSSKTDRSQALIRWRWGALIIGMGLLMGAAWVATASANSVITDDRVADARSVAAPVKQSVVDEPVEEVVAEKPIEQVEVEQIIEEVEASADEQKVETRTQEEIEAILAELEDFVFIRDNETDEVRELVAARAAENGWPFDAVGIKVVEGPDGTDCKIWETLDDVEMVLLPGGILSNVKNATDEDNRFAARAHILAEAESAALQNTEETLEYLMDARGDGGEAGSISVVVGPDGESVGIIYEEDGTVRPMTPEEIAKNDELNRQKAREFEDIPFCG